MPTFCVRQFLGKDILKRLLKKDQTNCEYRCLKKLSKLADQSVLFLSSVFLIVLIMSERS